jgi:hypothetical protein
LTKSTSPTLSNYKHEIDSLGKSDANSALTTLESGPSVVVAGCANVISGTWTTNRLGNLLNRLTLTSDKNTTTWKSDNGHVAASHGPSTYYLYHQDDGLKIKILPEGRALHIYYHTTHLIPSLKKYLPIFEEAFLLDSLEHHP